MQLSIDLVVYKIKKGQGSTVDLNSNGGVIAVEQEGSDDNKNKCLLNTAMANKSDIRS